LPAALPYQITNNSVHCLSAISESDFTLEHRQIINFGMPAIEEGKVKFSKIVASGVNGYGNRSC